MENKMSDMQICKDCGTEYPMPFDFCRACAPGPNPCKEIEVSDYLWNVKHITFCQEVRQGLHPDFRVDQFNQLEFVGEMPRGFFNNSEENQ
jgi:hypothetical protein